MHASRSLPEPADFYRGIRRRGVELPDDILLFVRRSSKLLDAGLKAFHQRHVLIVPLSGDGTVMADGRALALKPGRCCLIPPFQFHHYAGLGRGRFHWLFITFKGTEPGGGVFTPLAGFWSDLLALVEAFAAQSGPLSDALSWRLALLLEARGGRQSPLAPTAPPGTGARLLADVRSLAQDRLAQPSSIADFARALGMSPSHLRQKFRRTSGTSLGRFLREFRLLRAAELLASGEANVSEAAEASGWDNAYAFSRAFRRYWGKVPKAFALARSR